MPVLNMFIKFLGAYIHYRITYTHYRISWNLPHFYWRESMDHTMRNSGAIYGSVYRNYTKSEYVVLATQSALTNIQNKCLFPVNQFSFGLEFGDNLPFLSFWGEENWNTIFSKYSCKIFSHKFCKVTDSN